MTEYECGFADGIKSKVSAELTPTLIDISKTMSEMLMPVISTALENALNDNNAITDTDVQPVKHGRWMLTNNPNFRKCSECGAWWSSDITDNCFTKYCPKCGARMDLKDGDTDA